MKTNTLIFLITLGFSLLAEASDNVLDKVLEKLGASETVDVSKTIDWGILPGPFVNPEQGLGIGIAAVGLYAPPTWQEGHPFSTVTITSYTSTSGSYGLGLVNRTYLNNDQWRMLIDGWISHAPSDYWGIGAKAAEQESNKTHYDAKRLQFNPSLAYELFPSTYLKVGWQWQSYRAIAVKKKGDAAAELKPGVNSGSLIGLEYDTRDFEPNPQSGSYINLEWSDYRDRYGSDFDYQQWVFNLRHYQRLTPQTIFAMEWFNQSFTGEVPWFDHAMLGDDQRMRGYYQGQYRDKHFATAQFEIRHSFNARHGMVAWLGSGSTASQFADLAESEWLPTLGVGYRFAFKARINVRIDLGVGKQNNGFYFQINEAF
ncbi:BamA/TamA family outer membrane protein [Vibrio cholerae]|nr:BamA/TamA family outer membrane protein [Vibrio cholerae]